MKVITMICLLFATVNTYAASTTVNPFSIEFYSSQNTMNVVAELTQTCHYEKIVWSDSAEYNTDYNIVKLKVKNTNLGNGLTKHTISLNKRQYLKITGVFKPTKECKSEIKLDLNDSNYSIGWANQYSRAISFRFWNFKQYSSDDSIFRPTTLRDQIENKVFTFKYTPVPSQVNITLLEDGEKISNLFIKTAAKDKRTNMPYRLK